MSQGYGMVPAPGYGMQQPQGGQGELKIHTSFFILMWILYFFSTKIEINGQAVNKPWGVSSFPMPAGTHQLRVSFNYLFGPAGTAVRNVTVHAGHTTTVRYSAPWLIFLAGDLTEQAPQPMQQLTG
jgi:hypothetical protein